MKRILLWLALGCLPLISSASSYFVAIYGDDSNPGTWEQPFRHLSKGASIAVAGDMVIVRDGVYDNESVVAPGYVVTLYNSGTPSAPITFIAEHRGGAVLDAMNTVTNDRPCDGASAYINVANASYIVIQGFVITRACDDAIHNNASAHDIIVRQNEFHHIANRVITDHYGRVATGCATEGHDIIIDANVIHDIGRINNGFTTSLDHGLYTSCNNETITNNIFYNQVSGWDIQLANGANNVLVANNTFASQNPGQAGQIMVWKSHKNLNIRNNIFFNAPQYAITNNAERVSGCEIDHNIISGPAAVYSGTGCKRDFNQMDTDPMFVQPEAHDYDLLAGSPAIAAGVNIPEVAEDAAGTSRPTYWPFDVGAYQLIRIDLSADFSRTQSHGAWLSPKLFQECTDRTGLLPPNLPYPGAKFLPLRQNACASSRIY